MSIAMNLDMAMLQMILGFAEDAPQLMLQLYILIRRQAVESLISTRQQDIQTLVSISFSFLSYSRALVNYYSYLKNSKEEKEPLKWYGWIVRWVWRTCMFISRVLTLVLFASEYNLLFFLVLVLHFVVVLIMLWRHDVDFFNDADYTREKSQSITSAQAQPAAYKKTFGKKSNDESKVTNDKKFINMEIHRDEMSIVNINNCTQCINSQSKINLPGNENACGRTGRNENGTANHNVDMTQYRTYAHGRYDTIIGVNENGEGHKKANIDVADEISSTNVCHESGDNTHAHTNGRCNADNTSNSSRDNDDIDKALQAFMRVVFAYMHMFSFFPLEGRRTIRWAVKYYILIAIETVIFTTVWYTNDTHYLSPNTEIAALWAISLAFVIGLLLISAYTKVYRRLIGRKQNNESKEKKNNEQQDIFDQGIHNPANRAASMKLQIKSLV